MDDFCFVLSRCRVTVCVLKYRQQYGRMSDVVMSFLKNNGFNKKDIDIYLDIFMYGQSFASSIAGRTGIDRTTVYSALKRLLRQGVIAQTRVNDVSAYMAVSPEIFVDRVDMRMADLKGEKGVAEIFVNEMKKLKKGSFFEPKIKIFEGNDSIKSLYEQTLKSGGLQKSFLTLRFIPAALKHFLTKQFIELKRRKKVFSRVLVAQSAGSLRYKDLDKISNRETRIVKKSPFDLNSEIILFGKKDVAIIDFHKQIYGMVISSETFYKTIEAIFDCVWEQAE